MNLNRTLLLLFCLLSGIVLGSMLTSVCAGVPGLSWLAYSQGISFSPALDLSVVRFNLELYMGVSVAQIFTIGIALFIYTRIRHI